MGKWTSCQIDLENSNFYLPAVLRRDVRKNETLLYQMGVHFKR